MARHYEFINAVLVALVAIVGMVFVLNPGTGAVGAFHESRGPGGLDDTQKYYQMGYDHVGSVCLSSLTTANSGDEWTRCCATECTSSCNALGFNPNPIKYYLTANPFEDCGKACINGCDVKMRSRISIGFNYRNERTSPQE